jgi:putative nucleotidyltransferase with HDIG domain
MDQTLITFLPEFSQIQDAGLRGKTLACWKDAMRIGGWQIDDLKDIPFTLLIPDCPVSFVQHVRAVTQTAMAAAKVLGEFYQKHYSLNMDYIIAGGLLHDIGKLLEYQKSQGLYKKSAQGALLRHPFSGAGLAMKHGLPDEIVHIIAMHAREGDLGYRTPEAIIIHHADFMNFEPLYQTGK